MIKTEVLFIFIFDRNIECFLIVRGTESNLFPRFTTIFS
jgi:hypothetical protein